MAVRLSLIVLVVAGCGGGAPRSLQRPAGSASARLGASGPLGSGSVAFVRGLSTDPDRSSHPDGLGVATGLLTGHVRIVRAPFAHGPGSVQWLSPGRLLVQDSGSGNRAVVFSARSNGLTALSGLGIRAGGGVVMVAPDRQTVATEPFRSVSCGPGAVVVGCYAPGRAVFVAHADGSARRRVASGLLRGWTPDGRLVVFSGTGSQFSLGQLATVAVSSGAQQPLLSSSSVARWTGARSVELGDLAFSADGAYVAVMAILDGGARRRQPLGAQRAIVVAHRDGTIVRVITSPAVISMLAWSPVGRQLAYTTSGFPSPHQVLLLRTPDAAPRAILAQAAHFDWITWSPDARWLLVDDPATNSWNLLRVPRQKSRPVTIRRTPRLGGSPVWCCPENHYAGS